MILHTLENKWAKSGVVLGLLVGATLLAFYLAGYFFLWKIKLTPYKATPFTVIDYWTYYGHQSHVLTWLKWCMAGGAVPAIGLLAILFAPVRRAMHGDARFAKSKEIEQAGLHADRGIILGRHDSRYLMLDGQQGVICAAPPRSGKGTGIVQPNMLNWPDSVVALDVRGESWRITSGYRAKFTDTFIFNPVALDGKTSQWNPLFYVSDDPVIRINDLQKIASMLSPDPAEGDPFWPASCRTLFLGLALYVFETPGLPRTFGEIVRQIMYGEGESVGEHWKAIIEARDETKHPLSGACKAALYDFIYTSGNTQSSIRKTFTAKLELWLNPLVDQATSGNSFDLRNLRRRRMSIYVVVRPADIDRLQLILNLFFEQMYDLNTDLMPEDDPTLKYQLMPMKDEFTALGRMPIFARMVGLLGGYNIRPVVIIQGISQLRSVYGPDVAETIVTCMGAMVVFAPKEQRHANEISEMLGDMTVKSKSVSRPAMSMGSGGSVSTSEAPRLLLKPQEVKQIGKEKELIFIENVNPIKCSKIRYYKERVFKKRMIGPAHVKLLPHPVLRPGAVRKPTPKPPGDGVTVIGVTPAGVTVKPGVTPPAAVVTVDRDITPADMDKLDKLDLSDFNTSFEKIKIPKGEPLGDRELSAAVDSFLESMMD
jgi:type IV secretion system protein VirD4